MPFGVKRLYAEMIFYVGNLYSRAVCTSINISPCLRNVLLMSFDAWKLCDTGDNVGRQRCCVLSYCRDSVPAVCRTATIKYVWLLAPAGGVWAAVFFYGILFCNVHIGVVVSGSNIYFQQTSEGRWGGIEWNAAFICCALILRGVVIHNTDFACLLRSYLGTAVGSYRPMIELREAAVLKK